MAATLRRERDLIIKKKMDIEQDEFDASVKRVSDYVEGNGHKFSVYMLTMTLAGRFGVEPEAVFRRLKDTGIVDYMVGRL
jgi:hypothetical protein